MMLCACVHEGDVLLHAPTRQLNPCFSSNEATFTFLQVRRKAAVQMKGRVLAAMWVQNSELGSKIPSASCLASLPSAWLWSFAQWSGALDGHTRSPWQQGNAAEGGGHIILTSSSDRHLIADVLVLVQSKSPVVLHLGAA